MSIERRYGVDEPGYEPPRDGEPDGGFVGGGVLEVAAAFLIPIVGVGLAVWRYRRGDQRECLTDLACAAVSFMLAFALLSNADAATGRYLTMARAKRAITTYETDYWREQGVLVSISGCRRHSARQVTCIAEATDEAGDHIYTTDWATILKHGIIRVHPGHFLIIS